MASCYHWTIPFCCGWKKKLFRSSEIRLYACYTWRIQSFEDILYVYGGLIMWNAYTLYDSTYKRQFQIKSSALLSPTSDLLIFFRRFYPFLPHILSNGVRHLTFSFRFSSYANITSDRTVDDTLSRFIRISLLLGPPFSRARFAASCSRYYASHSPLSISAFFPSYFESSHHWPLFRSFIWFSRFAFSCCLTKFNIDRHIHIDLMKSYCMVK